MAGYIQVIKVAKKDIPQVIWLLNQFVENLDEGAALNILQTRLDSPYFLYLYAKMDGEIAGILECQFRKELMLAGPREYGFIPLVYVLPGVRRRGVAKKMFEIANIWLKNAGAKEIVVYSGPKQKGLNPFLQNMGFTPEQAKFTKKIA